MIYNTTTAIKPLLIQGITQYPGFVICPAECLVNTSQELGRGRIAPLEPFVADGNVWDTSPEDVANLFHGVTHEFVRDWGRMLQKMERDNPNSPEILEGEKQEYKPPGRPTMLLAIKNEALRRRPKIYHNTNQKGA